jgi:hypothetical protein
VDVFREKNCILNMDIFMRCAVAKIVRILRENPGVDTSGLRMMVSSEGHTDESFRCALHQAILIQMSDLQIAEAPGDF